MVIGKGGEERVALQNKLTKEYGKTVIVNVIEVKSAATNAQLVAETSLVSWRTALPSAAL